MTLKKTILFLHRWIGLLSGLVVFIVSITGAIYVFEKELFALFHPSYVTVTEQKGEKTLPLSILKANAQRVTDHPITLIRVPATDDQRQVYLFEALKRRPKNDIVGVFINKEIRYWDRIFVDPYSGKVLGKIDVETNFFWIVRQIHQFLYLRRDVGSTIVGTSVLLFIITLLSGIFLWWPKNRKVAVKRLKINFSAKWKRLNYDLHQVLGFYAFFVAIVIAATGLVWSFKWWETSIYWLLDSKRPNKKHEEPKAPDNTIEAASVASLDLIWSDVVKKYGAHEGALVNIPQNASVANVTVYKKGNTWWSASDTYTYDLRSEKCSFKRLQNDKTLGMKWRDSNYDIHVGKIAGRTGMWIAFVTSLICASLPVTGFYIWYGRKFKKKKQRC